MTREELVQMREYQVAQASTEYWKKNIDNDEVSIMTAFEEGAQWADEHPKSPWISVEERLPDDMQKVIWVRKDGQDFFGHFHNHDNGRLYFVSTEAVTDVTGEWRDRVTHWMSIPQIKKGE